MPTGDWWARNLSPVLVREGTVTSAELANSAVLTQHVATANITSECLSANALQRSVVVPLPDLAAGTTSPLTSAFAVWTPATAVRVTGAWLNFLTSMVNTTVQTTPVGTLYNGASGALGTVAVATTNAPSRGAQVAFAITAATVAAAQAITYGMTAASSSGMDFPPLSIQIDYTSTA